MRDDGFVASEPLPFDTPAPPAPPSPTSPGGRERRRGPVALAAALVVVGGLAGGAFGAEVVLNRTPAPIAATSPAASSSVAPAQSPTTAAALYKQSVAGIVTITTEVARRGQVGEGTGSGIVLDQNGDILTNAHVVSNANQIQVTFNDGRTAAATLVSANSKADLAVVRVSVSGASLHPLPLGNSDTVRVGDAVYAIGAPFGLAGSPASRCAAPELRSRRGAYSPAQRRWRQAPPLCAPAGAAPARARAAIGATRATPR